MYTYIYISIRSAEIWADTPNAVFSLCYVKSVVHIMCSLESVLCEVFSLCNVKSLVCVM